MTITHNNIEVKIINGNEASFKELQQLCEEMPEVRELCRTGILIVYANSHEDIVPIEELKFT